MWSELSLVMVLLQVQEVESTKYHHYLPAGSSQIKTEKKLQKVVGCCVVVLPEWMMDERRERRDDE